MKKVVALIVALVMILSIGLSLAEKCFIAACNYEMSWGTPQPWAGENNSSHTYKDGKVNRTCTFKYKTADKHYRCAAKNPHIKVTKQVRLEKGHSLCGRGNDY